MKKQHFLPLLVFSALFLLTAAMSFVAYTGPHTPLTHGADTVLHMALPGTSPYLMSTVIIMITGTCFALLVAFLHWTLLSTRERAARIAAKITEDLKASQERHSLAIAGSAAGLWDWNIEKDHIVWDGQAYNILEAADNSELPQTMDLFLNRIHPDERAETVKTLNNHLENHSPFLARCRMRTDGNDEHRQYIWVQIRGQAKWDRQGKPVRLVGSLIDVSQQVKAEEKLIFNQKMEAMGQMTGGIAHDFNNILQVIIGNADNLQRLLPEDETIHRKADLIISAAERGASLTDRMLVFSREQQLRPTILSINNVILSMQDMLDKILGEKTALKLNLGRHLPQLKLDKAQLETALLNLAVNARDAMPQGGELRITTRLDYVNQDALFTDKASFREGEFIIVQVADSGTGMPRTLQKMIFDPFFTTKQTGKGTGLGLSLVYGFVTQSGGFVDIYSEPGMGSIFYLYFPVEKELVLEESAVPKRTIATDQKMEGRILVIEDDPLVRETVTTGLRTLGYDVTAASDPDEGMEHLEKGGFDLLFTDIVLPGPLSGPELALKYKDRYPEMKVFLTTGYEKDRIDEKFVKAMGNVPVLRKPYKISELAAEIRAHINDPEGLKT